MAVIFMDGFDKYSAIADMLTRGYTQMANSGLQNSAPSPRFGSGRYWHVNGNGAKAVLPSLGTLNTFTIGFAMYIDNVTNFGANGSRMVTFFAGASEVCVFGVDSSGRVRFGRGSDFTTNSLGSTAASTFQVGVWNYFEIEFVRGASTSGSFNIFMNGVSILSGSGVNTGSADVTAIMLTEDAPSANMYFDDLYVVDSASRLGECRIDTLVPTADTAQKDWTPSTGTSNFANVDDAQFNTDTDYNSASVAGNYDLYTMSDLPTSPASVFAVQTTMVARKDDATTRTVRSKLKSNATTQNGATSAMAASYTWVVDLYNNDPDTSAAWTSSSVNAAQIGVEVVS